MAHVTGISNFGPGPGPGLPAPVDFGYSYASYGSPLFNSPAFVPIVQNTTAQQKKPDTNALNPKRLFGYFTIMMAYNFLGEKSTQRILYNMATRDIQKGSGISTNIRYINSLLFLTPLVVQYQDITGPKARAKREQTDTCLSTDGTRPRVTGRCFSIRHTIKSCPRAELDTGYNLSTFISGVCVLPLDVGQGTESIERFYYNSDTDTCTEFRYNGTLGNENNFPIKKQCELVCRPFSPEGQKVLRWEILKGLLMDSFVFIWAATLDPLTLAFYTIATAKVLQPL